MKRYIPFVALLAAVGLVGCSGDGPSAKPVPTVVPESWSVSSLTASDSQVFVGTPVQIDIAVTKNGAPAPDGTTVELLASGPGSLYGFTAGNLVPSKGEIQVSPDASVVLEGGSATVFFIAVDDSTDPNDEPAGTYTIQARVNTATRSINVSYLPITAGDTLVLTSVNPDRGPYSGGQTVTIFGINIEAPAEVFFILNGRPYEAEVVNVVEGYDGWITVITPSFSGEDSSIEQRADIRVRVGVGSENEQVGRLEQGYTLLPDSVTQGPQIYGLSPTSGRSSGGEIVNVLGQGFGFPAANMVVEFTDTNGVGRRATIVAVAPDGTQIQVETPRFSTLPLEADEPQDVSVTTPNGSTTLASAFLVLADNPTPEIASVSPVSGPLDGGTLVTIFGSGFQAPVQVFFGELTALDVNVFNDTTPGDQDRITCVTPDYSTQNDVPPVNVDVRVVNMTSGNDSTLGGGFTFGDNLYISGNSPQEGNAGDLVVIYGSGFEDPLQVFFGSDQMEVLSVSGTEIVVRIPDDFIDECNPSSGTFKVVLLESNLEAEGGNFTIRGNSPTVLSVTPVIIPESDLGTPAADITINGQFFADDVLVQVGNYIAPSGTVTVESAGTIDVQNLPGIDELGITFDPTPCTLGGGQPGVRSASTPISVEVTNFPGACSDTLDGAIVIEPNSTVCTATPANLNTNPSGTWNFPNTAATTCSTNQVLTISNSGGEDATLVNPVLQTGTEFVYQTDDCPGTLGFGDSCSFVVQFCPTTAGAKTDQIVVSYQSASEGAKSVSVTLSGNGS